MHILKVTWWALFATAITTLIWIARIDKLAEIEAHQPEWTRVVGDGCRDGLMCGCAAREPAMAYAEPIFGDWR